MIFHVTTKQEWAQAQANGVFEAPSLQLEGFIHMSEQHQVAGVLQRYYAGKTDLILLHVDETKLTAPLKYEIAPSINEAFPHIYGTINLDAVITSSAI
ncbi:DUF952 domain-containing protein [Ferruginibacter yonginensis]|uniref:DUF952 domain-containing protein n=1 Tax=Ferruginibacter yonginensis TaxID=1310416 RepID=A0ABV8QN38_9BACT